MNSKEQYWKEKTERMQFQKDWAAWRKSLLERTGLGAIKMMPWMFTQKAYREYLDFKQLQAEEQVAHAGTFLDMTQPADPSINRSDVAPDLSTVMTTAIAE